MASVIIYQFGLVDVIKDSEDASGWYVGQSWYKVWNAEGISYLDLPVKFSEAYNVHHKGYYYLVAILFYGDRVAVPIVGLPY